MCDKKLFTFAEAAEHLAVPESTLRKKAARGEVPCRKVFRHTRFSAEDLQAIQQVQPQHGTARPAEGGTGARRPRASSRRS